MINKQIYADNAATTRLDEKALEAMLPWLKEEYANPSQPYSFSRNAKKAIAEARATIAGCINALPEEIYFTSGGTESDNWAIKGSAFSNPEKRATITSAIEHHAVLRACTSIEKLGYPVAYMTPDETGVISVETLNEIISEQTRLASVMMANNEIGTIEPIKELAALSHFYGATFHTDAVQAVGHIPIDVQDLSVDMLSASAHKFNGPKGIGFLYIRKGTELMPFHDGGAQEHGMRAGTEDVASIVGMATALQSNVENLSSNADYIRKLEIRLLTNLVSNGIDYKRNGTSNRIPGNVSLSFKKADGEALLHRLDLMGICVSTGSACDSVNTQISHVLQAINLEESLAKGTIRISLGKDNKEEDVDAIASALCKILKCSK